MKFLEAQGILSAFAGGPSLEFLFGTSAQPEPLDLYVRAAAAERGFRSEVRTLPFNTLGQALRTAPRAGEIEVFLLFPWDLVPEADWRSGVPESSGDYEALVSSARDMAALLKARPNARLVYVDAPMPPLSANDHWSGALVNEVRAAVVSVGATVLGGDVASLEAYLSHGLALASSRLGDVARAIVDRALERRGASGKVLVTDFDNTLWHGVVGEDGVENVALGPYGLGFPHFIYQTYLKRLKGSGVLLAGVTKNDPDLANAPLAKPDSVLAADDFVAVIASYHPKWAQLAELADRLNLGLDSFAFVDDNPVELAEVSEKLPQVRALSFPKRADGLPALLRELASFFHREAVTSEDGDRTAMYRRMLQGVVPKNVESGDLSVFLAGLGMKLEIRDRSEGDRTRAVQLINKTNQFNLNGVRRTASEVDEILAQGGHLYTAMLSDQHGAHGEILACLIDGSGLVRSWVMSCRVFQRRVEHAFLVWLASMRSGSLPFEFAETERNSPLRLFLTDPGFTLDGGGLSLDLESFAAAHGESLELFDLKVALPAQRTTPARR